MGLPKIWHEDLQRFLDQRFSKRAKVEVLHGKSGAGVWRIHDAFTSLIVKKAHSPNEFHFYRDAAPLLRDQQIAIPALYYAAEQTANYWLVIEDIPFALPQEKRVIDRGMISQLARLHSLPLETVPASVIGFQPSWSDEMTEKAFTVLPQYLVGLRAHVERIQSHIHLLFEKQALISGDPNPTNWGMRRDGTWVLYDWERFTYGSPAIDLAIVIAGLGNLSQFRELSTTYLEIREKTYADVTPVDQLAADISAAKLWTVIEYLTLYHDGKLEPDDTLKFITGALPGWLNKIEALF